MLFIIIKLLPYTRKELKMAVIYANLIIEGVKEFKDVPKRLKESVRKILIQLGLEELAVE